MRSDSQVGPARARAATDRRMLRARTMAPTQRAAQRNQHRMWSLGLRLDAHVVLIPRGSRGGGGGDGSYLCSTPSSSRDGGVECVFAFPEVTMQTLMEAGGGRGHCRGDDADSDGSWWG